MKHHLKIGTRGSLLALAQVDLFVSALRERYPDTSVEIVKIVTSGDKTQSQNISLADAGGKGLFAKEIEEALLAGTIDCAVHSMKDMPPVLPAGLEISCVLKREDPRDAFFSAKASSLDDLPQGAIVGTCSPRRQAIILARRPDLKMAVLRGNVDTRLKKLEAGEVDATILAVAGIKRIGRAHLLRHILEPDVMLPAASQGAIGIETRTDDKQLREMLAAINCVKTQLRITAERAFLETMDGSCRTPLAALMSEPDENSQVKFDVLAARPDGSDARQASYQAQVKTLEEARALGIKAGQEMKATLPPGYLS